MNLTKDTQRFIRWCGSVRAAASILDVPSSTLRRCLTRNGRLKYDWRRAVKLSGYAGRDHHLYMTAAEPARIVYEPDPDIEEVIDSVEVIEVDVSPDETGEPDDFDIAWAEYPSRTGTNSRKDARHYFEVRLRQGADPQAMIDGTIRYRKHCEATDIIGTSIVMQGRRFYGRGCHYEQEWEIPEKKSEDEIDVDELNRIMNE